MLGRAGIAPQLHVVLVSPEIHWNTGNVGRSCLATGAQLHLVQPLGFSLEEKQVRRAGLDYWPYVKPQVWSSWEALAGRLPELGATFFFATKARRSFWQQEFPKPSVLVFGCESVGLPDAILQRYPEQLLHIPMRSDTVRSLNLSTSAALAMYEVCRQWDG